MYVDRNLQDATKRLVAAATKNGVILGLFLFGTSRVGEFLDKGFPFVSIGERPAPHPRRRRPPT